MNKESTTYLDNSMGFLDSVLGACSITKTVLQDYGYIPPDPEERVKDFRGDLARMRHLCAAMAVPDERLNNLEALLDMLDQFIVQGRRATAEQEDLALPLNRSYVAWCIATFLEPSE